MKKISLITLFSVITFFAFSQQNDNQNCLLWQITGKDLQDTSYLYGTVHIIPASEFFFYDNWIEKVNKCKYLILEADLKIGIAKQFTILKQMKLPNDSTLSDYMSRKEFIAYQSYMLDSLHISSSKYKLTLSYTPFFSYSLLLDEIIPGDKMFYEKYLTNLAKKNKMKVIGLETVDYQLNLVQEIAIKEQIKMFLFDYSQTKQTDFKKEYFKTLALYKMQNLTELGNIEQDDDTDFYQKFVGNRNKNWIPLINGYIHKKPSFIAVGAGHLPGQNGVIQLLKNEGYTVTPVYAIQNN